MKGFTVKLKIALCVMAFSICSTQVLARGDNSKCEVDALQIGEATAQAVISNSNNFLGRHKIDADSDSLLLQLFMWAAIDGNEEAIKQIGGIRVDAIINRNESPLNRLLWILAQNNDKNGLWGDIYFSDSNISILNQWANRELAKSPLNIFTAMVSVARNFGGKSPGLREFSLIDIDIRSPEALFYMAGSLHGDEARYREVYKLLKEAAAGGEWRAFLGMAEYEKTRFKNCAERAQISVEILKSIGGL